MIPLAQFLTEFDDDDGTPFRAGPAPRGGGATDRGDVAPSFEHLSFAASGAPQGAVRPAATSPIPLLDPPANDVGAISRAVVASEPVFPPAPRLEDTAIFRQAVADARAEARAEALADAERDIAGRIEAAVTAVRAEEREAFDRQKTQAIAEARASWSTEEGSRLAGLLSARLDELETTVRTSFASVLKPVVLEARRRQSVADLADAAGLLIDGGSAFSLVASGPADLLAALSAALGARAEAIRMETVEGGVDLRVACDNTVVETRLDEWRRALDEALA